MRIAGIAVAAVVLVAAAAAAEEPIAFWLETRGLGGADVAALGENVERMAGGGATRLARAARPERAILLLRVWLGAIEAGEADAGAGLAGVPEPTGAPEPGGSPADVAAGPSQLVRLELVDIDRGERIFERRLRCRLPLVASGRIADHRLRAQLSYVVDRMLERGTAETEPPGVDTFGPQAAEKERLAPTARAAALYDAAVDAARGGYDEIAKGLMAEAQPLFKETGERRREGLAWEHLARLVATTTEEAEKAVSYAGQAVKIAREEGDAQREAWALGILAGAELRAGRVERAVRVARAATAMAEQEGDGTAAAFGIAVEGAAAAWQGHFERADGLLREAANRVDAAAHPEAAARIELAVAAAGAYVDERDRKATLARIDEVRERARAAGDLALERDAAFVRATVLYGTTNLAYLREGLWEAVRAYRLARRLVDPRGQIAARALLGAFFARLGQTQAATEYLFEANRQAVAAGYDEIATDSLELLATIAPDTRRAIGVLERVLADRRERGDVRGEIKVLSDLSRLHAGAGEEERAWERYRECLAAIARYVEGLRAGRYAEDLRGGLVAVLKTPMATRTEPPFLARFLHLERMIVTPSPLWRGEGR